MPIASHRRPQLHPRLAAFEPLLGQKMSVTTLLAELKKAGFERALFVFAGRRKSTSVDPNRVIFYLTKDRVLADVVFG